MTFELTIPRSGKFGKGAAGESKYGARPIFRSGEYDSSGHFHLIEKANSMRT